MRYGTKAIVDDRALFYDNADYEEAVKRDLFSNLSNGLYNNLKETVKESEDKMRGNKELSLVLHVYSEAEFSDKMKELDRAIQGLSNANKHRIKKIFKNDTLKEHKRNIQDKVYI